jgi:hypothetical protein
MAFARSCWDGPARSYSMLHKATISLFHGFVKTLIPRPIVTIRVAVLFAEFDYLVHSDRW